MTDPEELQNIDLEQVIINDLIKQLKQTHQEQLTYVSNAPGVVAYQKKRGIDTSKNNRRRIA